MKKGCVGKVFKNGMSQAVRLPKNFRIETSEVDVRKDGSSIVITPRELSIRDFFLSNKKCTSDFNVNFEDIIPQVRDF